METIVIIGSGMAGYGVLKELRKRGNTAPVVVLSADDGRAYAKPNLSNALAAGKTPAQLATADAGRMAAEFKADVRPHSRVIAIDTAAKRVDYAGGSVDYGRLVLALGASPRSPGLVGDGAQRVVSVNDLDDYTRFRTALNDSSRVAILGGGLIGCEFANDLAAAGHRVTVVHPGAWPLEALLPEAAGRHLAEGLAGLGVQWRFGRMARRAEQAGDGVRLVLDDGTSVEADQVLSAIGLSPRIELAREAGLRVNRGILVDRELRASVPDVYALGDCAEVEGLVLPFVQTLLIQARALAAVLSGEAGRVAYPAMPVAVKTPACPVAALPPRPGVDGEWVVSADAEGVSAEYRSGDGTLQGFALTGKAASRRMKYAAQAPALLA